MANQSYNIKDVYSVFNKIDGEFGVMNNGSEFANQLIKKYCPKRRANFNGLGTCYDYHEMATSGVINLVEMLKDKFDSKYDKLAEYAILFLSYKLNQHSEHKYKSPNLNDFYTNHIGKNTFYDKKIKDNGPTYKEIIDKKKDLMNINIKEISKFNTLFNILFVLYNGIKNNKVDCTKYPSYPGNFANKFEELNNDSNINGNSSYSKLLSTLSDDYNNLKNIYDSNHSCNFPPLPKVKTPPSKLIPVLSTFSVIPLFFGIAYKTIYKKKIKKSKEEIET
ncbi:PIR protein CIR protein [Plasmodium vinckei brucechwatti]|uniref:PIR protein CIR protein n=1 Tax=Plasmodium vinckei brucechwatti TaxID=119398 RepID=A0A6V7SF81_PLAVN|nr:PIR protein CIR protein [Plasmodium vinckei brucechwatti]